MSEDPKTSLEATENPGGVESVDFEDANIYLRDGISPARWERAKTAVPVADLIHDLFGLRGSPISCPFHGRDSKPSFYVYPRSNDCWCWGCGEVDGYWDNLKLVARHHGWARLVEGKWRDDRTRALKWLEAHYPMPELPERDASVAPDIVIVVDEPETTEPEESQLKVTAEDLVEPYVLEAARQVRRARPEDQVPLAQELLERLFTSLKTENPIPMARVVGAQKIRGIIRGTSSKG